MTIGERIKNIRNKLDMSQVDFADKINVSKQTLYKYENNIITNIPPDKIEAIASIGKVSPAYIMGWDDDLTKQKKCVVINVLDCVAAELPIGTTEEIIGTEEITEELARTGSFFGLKIQGDSMIPNICSGDVVIVRQQNDAETGDIVIASVSRADATCKRLRKYKDGVELIANNPSYAPLDFSNQEIIDKPVKIIGKVVELRRKF